MGFWNKMFPYSNVHELNLDWLISKMKELQQKIIGAVRYDEYQGLDDNQAAQARTNIKAAGADDVELQIKNTAVMYSEAQTLQVDAQARARKNIGAIEQNDAVSPNIVQGLTERQKAQARSNIQAQSPTETLNQGKMNFVQFTAAQSLTDAQKKQARDNIGAGTGGGGDPTGAVLYSKAQNLEEAQKYQARQNIDAISTLYVNDNFVAAYQGQTLTPAFKANARGNIAAVSYEAQTLTADQQAQARANIGAGTGSGSGANQVHVGDSAPTDADVIEWLDTSEDVSGYNIHELLLLAHPVGSIYQSVNDVSPVNLFGGTWERLKDMFLLAAGDTYTAGSTGGEATHALTAAEMPTHYHLIPSYSGENVNGAGWSARAINSLDASQTMDTRAAGEGNAHNNMPPYIAVYTWKRTA